MNVPNDLKYTETHEWVRVDGDQVVVGITDHAQAELTDIVYVELPQIGREVDAKQQIAVLESVKAAGDIYAPVSGSVTEVNTALESTPGLLNSDPYGAGWIFKLKLSRPGELNDLKTPEIYSAQLG